MMEEFLDRWTQNMFPCIYKQLFGIDCPFCGFQRAVIALLRGDFGKSFCYYPPLIPLLISLLLIIYLQISHKPAKATNIVLIIDAAVVLVSCVIKNLFFH